MEMAVMLITHDLGVVSEIADRVAVMYAGRVVECGSIESIIQKMRHPYTRGLIHSIPAIEKRQKRLPAIQVRFGSHDLPVGCKFHPV
jgi:ABC-type dipeptide/oligopeptide/nickel transport system ATPase component